MFTPRGRVFSGPLTYDITGAAGWASRNTAAGGERAWQERYGRRGDGMDVWAQVMRMVLAGVIGIFFEPMFWLILLFIGVQYWQMQRGQVRMFGFVGFNLWQQVVQAAVLGALGGVLASILLIIAGISLSSTGLNYIWPVALLLMLIRVRYLCFAYAGGLVSLVSLLTGWPDVLVPHVLALVGILHVTESFLIFVSGRYGAVPVFLRRPDGRVVGAFNLVNFWPLPLVMLVTMAVPQSSLPAAILRMPEWWPLISPPAAQAGYTWVYSLMPVVAALGYTDMAVTSPPRQRRIESARNLALYSVILIALAILGARYAFFLYVAAVLSPVGHEFLILLDNAREREGEPYYVPPPQGVKVLATIPSSPAQRMGVQSGDVIVAWDGVPVRDNQDLAQAIAWSGPTFVLTLAREGREHTVSGHFATERQLGVIPAPQGDEPYFWEIRQGGLLDAWWQRLRRR